MLLTYRYHIYPSEIQKLILAIHFGHNRFVWNEAMRFIGSNGNRYTSRYQLHGRLPQLKKKYTWLKEAHSQTLQATIKRFDLAYQRFFKKQSNKPKPKKRNSIQSIEFPQNVKVDFDLGCIRLPKLNYVKAKFHRKFKGEIKTCYVSMTPSSEYFVSLVVEDSVLQPPVNTDAKLTGVDLGITDLAITSTNKKYENIKPLQKKLKKLAKAKRVLARRSRKKHTLLTVNTHMFGPFSKEEPLAPFVEKKEVYSNRREKARLHVARIYRDITNARDDNLHKISRKLVDENEGLAFESLNIRGMVKNKRLARSILDCSWGKLVSMCEYKAAREGKPCIRIGTFVASSKTCHVCGHKYHGLTLNERTWKCEVCNTEHNRDINAAINIAAEGQRLLQQKIDNGFFESQEKSKLKAKTTMGTTSVPIQTSDEVEPAGLAGRGEECKSGLPPVFSEARKETSLDINTDI